PRASCERPASAAPTPARTRSRRALVIHNTTIVTSDAARTVHHDASIAVDADRIVAIGPTQEINRHWPGAERMDGHGKAIFPGLGNCHTHLWLTGARRLPQDLRFP